MSARGYGDESPASGQSPVHTIEPAWHVQLSEQPFPPVLAQPQPPPVELQGNDSTWNVPTPADESLQMRRTSLSHGPAPRSVHVSPHVPHEPPTLHTSVGGGPASTQSTGGQTQVPSQSATLDDAAACGDPAVTVLTLVRAARPRADRPHVGTCLATVVADDTSVLDDDAAVVADDAPILEDDATVVADDAAVVGLRGAAAARCPVWSWLAEHALTGDAAGEARYPQAQFSKAMPAVWAAALAAAVVFMTVLPQGQSPSQTLPVRPIVQSLSVTHESADGETVRSMQLPGPWRPVMPVSEPASTTLVPPSSVLVVPLSSSTLPGRTSLPPHDATRLTRTTGPREAARARRKSMTKQISRIGATEHDPELTRTTSVWLGAWHMSAGSPGHARRGCRRKNGRGIP